MSQEKISCLIFLAPIPNKKISCLLSKRKSPVSWEILMSHAFSLNPKRKSHEIWDFLMRQETQDFFIEGSTKKSPVSWENLMSQEKISYLKRKSHVSRENLMSYQFWAPPPTGKYPVSCLMRKSLIPPIFLYHTSMSANIIPPVS